MRIGSSSSSRSTSTIAALVGEKFQQKDWKWFGCVKGGDLDECIYGVPYNSRRVVKFNPKTKAITFIGDDLGSSGWKWWGGVLDRKGCIYCIPYRSRRILKIDSVRGTTKLLDVVLPESGNWKWSSGVLAPDGCIYFMPYNARRILKLNPRDDTVSSIGDDFGGAQGQSGKYKFKGAVLGLDGCVYGIPFKYKRILKFDPSSQTTSFIGAEAQEYFQCGDGVVARDGNIYSANHHGTVLKIDVRNRSYGFVRNTHPISAAADGYASSTRSSPGNHGWGDPTVGQDGAIYWPPMDSCQMLKFDPVTNITCHVDGDFHGISTGRWVNGVLAKDGVIYCIPLLATRILAIDPFNELRRMLWRGMKTRPHHLGGLFDLDTTMLRSSMEEDGMSIIQRSVVSHWRDGRRLREDELSSLFFTAGGSSTQRSLRYMTNYEVAMQQYGQKRTLDILNECIPFHTVIDCEGTGFFPFVVAAQCKNVSLSAIYHFLRKDPAMIDAQHHCGVVSRGVIRSCENR